MANGFEEGYVGSDPNEDLAEQARVEEGLDAALAAIAVVRTQRVKYIRNVRLRQKAEPNPDGKEPF